MSTSDGTNIPLTDQNIIVELRELADNEPPGLLSSFLIADIPTIVQGMA